MDGPVTIASLIQTVNPPNLQIPSSPSQSVTSEQQAMAAAASRGGLEALYTINHSGQGSGSQFQIARTTQDALARNEQILREHLSREGMAREVTVVAAARDDGQVDGTQEAITRQLDEAQQQQQQQQQNRELDEQATTITTMTVDADGNITSAPGRGLLLSQGVLPGHLQFTTLLNSELITIGEDVIRNSRNGVLPAIFQQKFGPTQ